jgi:hypothetical protein
MSRRHRRRSSSGEGWKFALGAVLALAALAALGGIFWLNATTERPPVLNAKTLCPVDGPRAVTVVLLDSSDDLPDAGRRQVTTALFDLADALPIYGLLELRVLDPADPAGRVLFSRCNPGTGAGLTEWTANPAAARKRWLADFREPLGGVLGSGLTNRPADTSPIMAAIQRIAVDHFEGRAVANIEKQLVIVSDMIENTPDYSQYGGDVSFAHYQGSTAAKKLRTDLHGAAVTVYYVQRLGAARIDSGAHIRFWQDWVAGNHGTLAEAVKLQGAG